MDDERRARVLAYFKLKFKDDRQAVMKKTHYSRAQMAHYYNPKKPLGERAGRELATRLGLHPRYFEIDRHVSSAPPPSVNEGFADPEYDTDHGVLEDLDALHPDDKKAWVSELHAQAEKAREIGRREIARLARIKKETE